MMCINVGRVKKNTTELLSYPGKTMAINGIIHQNIGEAHWVKCLNPWIS
jgi:hypothetical protein